MSEPSLFDLDAPAGAAAPDPADGAERTGRLSFDRIAIVRMPGFEEGGFVLDRLAPGVNLVHGPNASGKSTTARAIRWLLWPPRPGGRAVDGTVGAALRLDGERWEIDVDRDRVRHRRDGAPTDEGPALPPADAADRYTLALHDLLQADVRGDELAAAVAREAAGGYDLEAARAAAGAKPKASRPQKLFDEHEAAAAEARRVADEQRRIAREAEELARWEAELAAARAAQARVARLDAALEHARCRVRLQEARAELAAYPAALERVRGTEDESLADHRRRLEEARGTRERLAAEAAAARRRLEEALLPEDGLPDGVLETLAERRERAARLEQEIDALERELEGARRRRDDVRREIGEAAKTEPETDESDGRLRELTPDAWRPVLELARRADELAGQRATLDGLDEWTAGREGERSGEEIDRRLAAAGAEARLLHDWLRESGGGWRARRPALAAAVALAAIAVWGGLSVAPWLWALAGVAAAVVAWCWLDVAREERRRRFLEEEHARAAGGVAFRFEPDAVGRRLGELETQIAALRLDAERLARRAGLDERRTRLARATEELESERAALVERLGLAPAVGTGEPAPLAAFVQALCRWREADADVRHRERSLAECRRQLDRELEAIRSELGRFGAPADPGRRVSDAASARGAIEALDRRAAAHREAKERLDRLDGPEGEVARAEREAERAEAAIRELFGGLDLADGDDAGLHRLLDRLDEYRAACDCKAKAATALELASSRLPDGEDAAALLERSEDELAAERQEAAAIAATADERLGRIERLRGEIERLRRQHALEDARAAHAAAADALRADRERETRAVVAGELADWVRERTTRTQRPAVLKRAAALFARITGGAFRLDAPAGDPPVFRARDSRAGRTRDLDQLSGGRRLQLLVAARMGFVEEQERGVRVPLVLDETLANSDDESAAALIEAMVEIAREGRQVFYFTAQADEVAKWRAALEGAAGVAWREVDLAAVRRGEEAARAPRGAWEPSARSVPAPGGADRAAYGERLRVPGIDPLRDAGEVHVWHLVEEPATLHALLVRGIERWGELETLLRDGGAGVLGAGDGADSGRTRARIEARARCVSALIESWRIGRGRAVDRAALAESGAVSERFLDEVCDLAARLEGSADALISALEAGEVTGFRSLKIADLAAHLAERGHRDEREVLERAALRERVLTATAAEVAAGDLTLDAVDELLSQVLGPCPADERGE